MKRSSTRTKFPPIRTVAQAWKRMEDPKIFQSTTYTGNPVLRLKKAGAPKSVALRMETKRLLGAHKLSFRAKPRPTIAVVKERARLNVDAVYKKRKRVSGKNDWQI